MVLAVPDPTEPSDPESFDVPAIEDEYKLKRVMPKGCSTAPITPSQKGKSCEQNSPGVASRNVVKTMGKQNRPGTLTNWEDSSDGGKLPLARSTYMLAPDR
ncbi:hypothetical protein PILCRDRAFT_1640 [Piloderma croceum F 1598]|uniref:Uncharacterized protein n=1 Tax=Piloderma croceum (strain F 1598) TaxID=765440 RepID=A0A0C3CKX8_PILCF|nr:hypothetical protein PILCRDRAFT_1640 [Piloderma croceum F 1598]